MNKIEQTIFNGIANALIKKGHSEGVAKEHARSAVNKYNREGNFPLGGVYAKLEKEAIKNAGKPAKKGGRIK